MYICEILITNKVKYSTTGIKMTIPEVFYFCSHTIEGNTILKLITFPNRFIIAKLNRMLTSHFTKFYGQKIPFDFKNSSRLISSEYSTSRALLPWNGPMIPKPSS